VWGVWEMQLKLFFKFETDPQQQQKKKKKKKKKKKTHLPQQSITQHS
jgi:hypothetical protein